jgi:hypothetical protein
MKGWFKYLMVRPSAPSQNFELNSEFETDSMRTSDAEREQQDDVGYINIPDANSF